MGRLDRICTTGFSKMSERQVSVWDSTDVARGPVKQMTVDVSSSTLMPFWSDNDILFLAGKGDGNVRYYEYEADDLCVQSSPFGAQTLTFRCSHFLCASHGRRLLEV